MPIARGRAWLDEIVSGTASIEAIAARQKCSVRHVNMTLSIRFDQCGTSLLLHWPRARSCGRGWKQDLLEPLGWRLCPRGSTAGSFLRSGQVDPWSRLRPLDRGASAKALNGCCGLRCAPLRACQLPAPGGGVSEPTVAWG